MYSCSLFRIPPVRKNVQPGKLGSHWHKKAQELIILDYSKKQLNDLVKVSSFEQYFVKLSMHQRLLAPEILIQ